jgi:hypothetical protein
MLRRGGFCAIRALRERGRQRRRDRSSSRIAIARPVRSKCRLSTDSGVAIAVMRNRIVGDMSAAAAIDQMVADHLG